MPYTDVWSDAIPADSAAANTVGAQLRQLRLDIHERLNTIIGAPIATALADPLMPVYAPGLFIPVHSMLSSAQSGVTIISSAAQTGGINVNFGTQVTGFFSFGIVLPAGCILGNVTTYSIVNLGTLEVVTTIYHLPFSTATIGGAVGLVTLGSDVTSGLGTGFRTTQSTGQSGTVITAGDEYYGVIELVPSSGGSDNSTFFGVEVNYTRPAANLVY